MGWLFLLFVLNFLKDMLLIGTKPPLYKLLFLNETLPQQVGLNPEISLVVAHLPSKISKIAVTVPWAEQFLW